MKRIKKNLVFFTLLTSIMLSTIFILPPMLFADTFTFPGIGDTNYNDGNYDFGPEQISWHFDITGVNLNEITNVTLRVWADDVEQTGHRVYFEGSGYLGELVLINVSQLSEFDVNPTSIILGENDAKVDLAVNGDAVMIYDSELVINTGGSKKATEAEEEVAEPAVWVRNHDMQCWQVWINEDNAFEFVFVWEYANNNHVQIFDMAGNIVFETDMEKGNAHFVAALPDGMYTVKTFHEPGQILQEFVIGKP